MLKIAIMFIASLSMCYGQIADFVYTQRIEPPVEIVQEEVEQPWFEIRFEDGQDVTEYITTPEREKEAKMESNIEYLKEWLEPGNPLTSEMAIFVASDLSDLGCGLIIKDYEFDDENLKFIVEDIDDNEFIIYLDKNDNGNYFYDHSEKYEKLNENAIGNSIIFDEKYVKTFPLTEIGFKNVKTLMSKLRLSNDDAVMLVLEIDNSDFGLVEDAKLNAITRGETGEQVIYHYILTNEDGKELEIKADIDQNSSNGSRLNFIIKN